jgi:hypothetical protein
MLYAKEVQYVLSPLKPHRRSIAIGWMVAALVLDGCAMGPRMPAAWLYGLSGFCWGMLVTSWFVLAPDREKELSS